MSEADLLKRMNHYADRVTLMLGMITPLLWGMKKKMNLQELKHYEWFQHAIEEVVYKGNPLPPLGDE